jgi:hypothetical protein
VLAEGERLYGVYLRRETTAASFSARWTGRLIPPARGFYQIHVTSNDGARVRIDGRDFYEDWTAHGTKTDTVGVDLGAGRPEPIVVEYFYSGGAGVMRLAWTRPDGVRETIPASAWQGNDGAPGLAVAYFRGIDLTEAWFTATDAAIDHEFGSNGPPRPKPAPAAASTLDVRLPAGTWGIMWLDPVTGRPLHGSTIQHGGGVARLRMPRWTDDVAVSIRRDPPPAPPAR